MLRELSADFPDLSVSKVRYLESAGLVRPGRAPSGYRRYDDDDVARLRFVLVAQRDHFWPLRVIGEVLDAWDRGLDPPEIGVLPVAATSRPGRSGTGGPTPGSPTAGDEELAAVRVRSLRLTRGELCLSAGIDEDTLAEVEGFGLVSPTGHHYGESALAIAREVAALGRHGIEARHLRPLRSAADREVSLVAAAIPRSRRRTGSPGGTDRSRAEALAAFVRLRTALVRAALEDGDDE